MKKKFIKVITILTLIACLTIGLVSCAPEGGDTGNSGSGGGKPSLKKIPYDQIVTNDEQNAVESFFAKVGDIFGKPFEKVENADNIYFATSGLAYLKNEGKSTYYNFGVEAVLDRNITDTLNKNAVLVTVTIGDTKSLNTGNEKVVNMYYAGKDTDDCILFNSTTLDKKIKLGNINDLKVSLKDFFDLPNTTVGDLLNEIENSGLGGMISSALGCTITDLVEQQVPKLLAKAMYDTNNMPAFSENDGVFSFNINSGNVTNALQKFFARGANVASGIANETYDPIYDYNNSPDKKDDLKNNSDMFFSKFNTVISALNVLIKEENNKLAENIRDWTNVEFSENAFNLKVDFTKTENGIENGKVAFKLDKNASISLPKSKEGLYVIPFNKDIECGIENFAMTVKPKTTETIDLGDKQAKFDEINAKDAQNLVDINTTGKFDVTYKKINNQGHFIDGENTTITKTYTATCEANIDIFSLLKIDKTRLDNAELVKSAFGTFSLVIMDGETEISSVKWENDSLVVRQGANVVKTYDAEKIAQLALNAKGKILALMKSSLFDLIDLNAIRNIKDLFDIKSKIISADIDVKILGLFKLTYKDIFGEDIFGEKETLATILFPNMKVTEDNKEVDYKVFSFDFTIKTAPEGTI